jgi:type I restriction enzyme S subunit
MVPLKSVLSERPRNGYSPKEVPEWTGMLALGLGCLTSEGFVPRQLKRVPNSPMARQYLLKDGDLLMSRANTRDLVGLVGRYRDVGHPCIYPDLMMRLRPDESRCLPEYLEIALRANAVRREVRSVARGTSESMVKVSASLVEGLTIPLPELEEQRLIVDFNAAFGRRIATVERTLAKLQLVEDAVVAQAMSENFGHVQLAAWLQRIEAGKSPLAEDTPAGSGEWGVLKVSAVQSGWFKPSENKVVREAGLINPRYEVQSGDLIMTRANTEDLVGLACVAHDPPPRLMLSDKTLRLVPDRSLVEPEFIEVALADSAVRAQVKAAASGTSGSMKNIPQEAICSLLVPDVPLPEQRHIVKARAAVRRRRGVLRDRVNKLRLVQKGILENFLF